jgi:hypothetical protein
MFIKEHNSNHYVFLKYDDYSCKRFFYDELIRIQYNKVYAHPSTLDDLESILKQTTKQINKQNSQRPQK